MQDVEKQRKDDHQEYIRMKGVVGEMIQTQDQIMNTLQRLTAYFTTTNNETSPVGSE